MFLVKPNTWRLALKILTWLSWLSTGLKRPVELEVKAMSTILAAAKIEQPAVGPNRASRRPKPPSRSTESPSACRYRQSQATPSRRVATGSSWPSIGQRRHGCCQRHRIDRARDPHPNPGRKLDLDRPAAGRAGWHRRRPSSGATIAGHEADLSLGGIVMRGPKRSSPPGQQRPRYAISSRRRRDLPRRSQALQDDLELLILGPTTTPARIHHFEPLDLGTALITVHKDSSQH